jgi:hypothetical protein
VQPIALRTTYSALLGGLRPVALGTGKPTAAIRLELVPKRQNRGGFHVVRTKSVIQPELWIQDSAGIGGKSVVRLNSKFVCEVPLS